MRSKDAHKQLARTSLRWLHRVITWMWRALVLYFEICFLHLFSLPVRSNVSNIISKDEIVFYTTISVKILGLSRELRVPKQMRF